KMEQGAKSARQQREKPSQPWQILFEVVRQLEQHGPQPLLERAGRREKCLEKPANVSEPAKMCNLLRRFEGEFELGGNLLKPILQVGNLGYAAKRAVGFDRVELRAVVAEHLVGRQIGGIERAFPLPIGVAARADIDGHGMPSNSLSCDRPKLSE